MRNSVSLESELMMKNQVMKRMKINSKYSQFLTIFCRKETHAFEIDSECKDGRVALIYRATHSKP